MAKIISEWVRCPVCGNKTRLQIQTDTELKNFPLYCPKCKQKSLIDAKNLQITVIKEPEAAVVRIIFDKYVHEGYGAQRIATYLNKLGYRARSGKMWHHATIRGVCALPHKA